MRKKITRIICILLCLILFLAVMPNAALADEDNGYRDRVLKRYEDSLSPGMYYTNLLDESSYMYKQWADSMDDKSSFTKAYLWSIDFLLDKNLGTNEYVTYLSKILNMMEYGFSETSAAQAEYTAKLQAADYFDGAVSIAANALPGSKAFARIKSAAKYLDSGIDVAKLGSTMITDMTTLGVLSASTVAYEKKVTVLEAVIENSNDDYLTQAAQDLLSVCDLQYIYMLENYTQKAGELASGIAYDVMDMDFFEKVLPNITKDIADNFTNWLKKHANASTAKEVAGFVSACGALYSTAAATLTGVLIGAEIMKLAVGDEAELIRETKAMDVISDALAPAFSDANARAADPDPNAGYDAVKDFVALGEALVYTHLRGDYCLYSVSDAKEADEYMHWLDLNLSNYYEILSKIFTEKQLQVIITSEVMQTEKRNFSSIIFIPTVHIPGNNDIAEKINTDPSLKSMLDNAYADSDEFLEYSKTANPSDLDTEYSFSTSAYTCGAALCMTFHHYSYAAGAAHFNTSDLALTYDLETGDQLFLKSMLNSENPDAYNELLELMVYHMDKNNFFTWTSTRDVAETLLLGTTYDLGSLVYAPRFTAEGLLLKFSPYDIAPYAAGYQTALIPYSELKGIFADKYLPVEKDTNADITVYKKGDNDMPAVARSHGTQSKRALIATNIIWDVSVDQKIYMGGMFNKDSSGTGTVFYANYMQNELFWIPDTDKGDITVFFNGKDITL